MGEMEAKIVCFKAKKVFILLVLDGSKTVKI
jgi:hypothetical protein